jgi:hypothetical protein
MLQVALCLSTAVLVSGSAPELYTVSCETTKGPFDVSVHRAWAPKGADRFHELVIDKFYDDAPFFRMVENFVVSSAHLTPRTPLMLFTRALPTAKYPPRRFFTTTGSIRPQQRSCRDEQVEGQDD